MTAKALLKFSSSLAGSSSRRGHVQGRARDVLANDEQAVALQTGRAERAAKHFEDNTVLIAYLRDGEATEVWLINMPSMSSGRNAIAQAIDSVRRR